MEGAEIGIIAFGSTEPAILEARDRLAEEGVVTDFMRVRALPFTDEVEDFIRSHARVHVVELNRDGQMCQLLTLAYRDQATKLISIGCIDGLPPTARWVRDSILSEEAKVR
jgi:2-oxoglutarate ferredoxin oxidoreductase subunit alpha